MKTLLKNEFIKFMRLNEYNGKKESKISALAAYLIVMGLIGILFAFMSFGIFYVMFPAFIGAGIGWTGFTYAGILAVVFSTIGSVFMSQSQLYRAKDNDLLLSLPIPPKQILFCRMLPLYVQNFYFCILILLPSYVAYAICGGVTVLSVIFFLVGLLVVPLFSLTLCCLLGVVVAFVAARVKHSNIISVILSLLFFGAYFVVYMQFNKILTSLIENGEQVAGGIKAFAYPLYLAGRMFEGDLVGASVTTVICCGLFALLYLLLSKTYIGIITRSHVAAKSVYHDKKLKKTSAWRALIAKESKRFFRSTAYLLNCGLGVVLLLAAAVALIIFGGNITAVIQENVPALGDIVAPIACLIICFVSSTDGITAPSISLEGKSLYILQSLPVESWKPLFSKVFFHVIFNTPVAVVCGLVAAIVLKVSALSAVMLILMPIPVNFLFAALGLIFNLKKPMLDWANETTVIKQSISVLFLMLSMMGIYFALAGLFFAARLVMSAEIYLCLCFVILACGAAGAMVWLKRRGANIWDEL